MDRKELKKASGDVFFEAEHRANNSYIYVNWIGIQSLETMMMGGNTILSMLRTKPCSVILNNNHELIGPWNEGANYLGSSWAPKARLYGVKQFLQVLAPGIYGRRSFQEFQNRASQYFQIEAFETDKEAISWLQTHLVK